MFAQRLTWWSVRWCGGTMGCTFALLMPLETPLETLTKKLNSLFTVRNFRSLTLQALLIIPEKNSFNWCDCLSSLRLVDGVVNHSRCPPPDDALLYLLLSVLPSEMLLLRSLSLLPAAMLLSRKRYSALRGNSSPVAVFTLVSLQPEI